jgi:ABC-type transport system involved in Fe-S cluster assembly fused permease/ATPase subunit
MFFMFTGKWFNTRVPFMLQKAIDSIPGTLQAGGAVKGAGMSVAMAVLFYGLSRATAVFCEELKTCLFTNVSQNVLRKFAHQIFTHLHTLGADFHLQTPSGVISVAYVRAVRGFQALMFQLVFSVAPMALELAMVARIMYKRFSPTFSAITLATFTSYLIFTIYVTQWRVRLRKEIVEVDNARNGFFIDSLLNHEVVKLFNNEKRETKRFDSYLERMQKLNIDSTYAVAALNVGQAVLFCAGLTASLLVALGRVQRGVMSVGDVVAVNAMLLQLAIPFDFIGYTCKYDDPRM